MRSIMRSRSLDLVAMAGFVGTGKKIVAIGRNYVKHAMELNNPVPSEPFWFLKPTTSYVTAGKPVIIPRGVDEIHHEVEEFGSCRNGRFRGYREEDSGDRKELREACYGTEQSCAVRAVLVSEAHHVLCDSGEARHHPKRSR
mmetsp:Transcript_48309/g.151511  ORF Transcript_48309/g.151511 Transcript_48309/m.151511 type:complete len:142 (-) Transcript_48309:20-445(-)